MRNGSKLAGAIVAVILLVGASGAVAAAASSHSKTHNRTHTSSDKKKAKSSPKSATASTAVLVKTSASSKYGTILVTSSGLALYMLTADSPSKSVCTGACPSIWPPLTTKSSSKAGEGANAKLLRTIARSGSLRQIVYNGHPLYTYSGDSAKGQVNGEGIDSFGGHWYVLDSAGKPVTKAVSSSKSSSKSTSSGGYGY
jgi:predicted lipoprotein with Yx(FWY)xxD motif